MLTNTTIINDSNILTTFCNALDYPKKLNKTMVPIVSNKSLLVVETTWDKYQKAFTQYTKSCIGINCSINNWLNQITNFLDSIPNYSIDTIIWSWLSYDFQNINDKNIVIQKLKNKLKKWWEIYLIENDNISEFEEITWKYQIQPNPTLIQNSYIMNELWFKPFYRFETFFKFEDINQAQNIFWKIFGETIIPKIKNRTIQQRIIIFKKSY